MAQKQKNNLRQEQQTPDYQAVTSPAQPCPQTSHNEHLCELIKQGILQRDITQYQKLVEHANFICERCGVSAASPEYLCWPIPLKTYANPVHKSPWKRFAHNLKCLFHHHPQHLCHMMYEGFHERDPAQYKTLVDHPKFYCQICFRTAAKKENLCRPEELPS